MTKTITNRRTFEEDNVSGCVFQAFCSSITDGVAVDAFKLKFGYRPAHVLRHGTIILVGPLRSKDGYLR